MPIFEFVCETCGASFEKLLASSAQIENMSCGKCGSKAVKRKVSGFAAFAKTPFGSCPASKLCPEKLHEKYGTPGKEHDCCGHCPHSH